MLVRLDLTCKTKSKYMIQVKLKEDFEQKLPCQLAKIERYQHTMPGL